MSQFKRFNASENNNWDNNFAHPQGTLTWDQDNGLRLHDGYTSGGNQVGGSGFSGNYYDLNNRPNGSTAVHDLIGGGSSVNNGNFLQQTSTGESGWMPLPNTYDALDIGLVTAGEFKGGIVGNAGTKITGITVAQVGSGSNYQQVFIGGNQAFDSFYSHGADLVGWKIYPSNDPSSFLTVTDYIGNSLGAPGLTLSNWIVGTGPWTAESSDYNAGVDGPVTLTAGSVEFGFSTGGVLQLPPNGDIHDSNGVSVLGSGAALGTLTISNNEIEGASIGQVGTRYTKTVDINGDNYPSGGGTLGFLNFGGDGEVENVKAGWIVTFANGQTRTVSYDAFQPLGTYWNIGFNNAYNWLGGDVFPLTLSSPDYTPGSTPQVVLTANNKSWTFNADGDLQLPAGGDVVDSNGTSIIPVIPTNKASTSVNAAWNTEIALGTIKAKIGSSGIPIIASNAGTRDFIWSTTYARNQGVSSGGSGSALTFNTSYIYGMTVDAFSAVSDSMVVIVQDLTSSVCYRITFLNGSSSSGTVVIEKLV